MKKFVLLISIGLVAISGFSQNGKEVMKVTDMARIKSVNSIALNADGSKAVITLTTIEPDGDSKWEYKYVNQLWLVSTEGFNVPRQLTSKENASQAAWSPDGKRIAFARVVDGKSQVFILPLDGGEAVQLTKFKYGAGGPKWSPDGKRILFSSSIPLKDLLKDSLLNPGRELPKWPLEKPGFDNNEQLKLSVARADPDGDINQARAYLEDNAADKKAKVVNKLNFQDETEVSTEINFSHLFIVDAIPDAKPVPLTRGFYRFNSASFTPDGKQVVFAGSMDSLQNSDRVLESAVFIMNTDGSNLRTLLSEKGRSYSSPQVSSSGQWLAFQYGTTSFVNVPVLALVPLSGTGSTITDIPFDRSKSNLVWSPDDKYIYFTAQSNGGIPIYKATIKTKKVEMLSDSSSGVNSFAIAGDKLVFARTEVADPSEVYTANLDGQRSKRITAFNTAWLQSKQLSFPEKKTFVNNKGQVVEYWIMKPLNYQPGKKYPLLLEIHGGPSAMWGPGENSMWHEYQYFCGKGYGVVYCNPRGSGGYGLDFLRGNVNDWGAGPTSDVLTALDKTVDEGWADTSRLLVTGGSYAGYLVAWIVGHDKRFKAACAQRGVYDLATFFGEGNAWRLVPNYFGGYPWEPKAREILNRESPITYVQDITTPLIIFHGESDRRTGVIQGEMLYRSLKVLGRPVEYVRHPGATHELTRSGNNRQRIDQLLRTWEFFERWIH